MIKDINNQSVYTANGKIEDLETLFIASLANVEDESKIIGFAKYHPFLNTDHRFRQQLEINCWYPIMAIKKEDIFLEGYKAAHYGLFQNLVALEAHKDKFSHLVIEDNPRVERYWNRKKEESKKYNENLEELYKKTNKEKEEFKEIKTFLLEHTSGKPVKRKTIITDFIKNRVSKEELLNKIKSNDFLKEEVLNDIEYRIKRVNTLANLDKDHIFYEELLSYTDKRGLNKLKEIKEEILKLSNIVENKEDLGVIKKIKEGIKKRFKL